MLYALNEDDTIPESALDAVNDLRSNNLINYISFNPIKKSYFVKPMKKVHKKSKHIIEKTATKLYPGLTKKIKNRWLPLLESSFADNAKRASSKEQGSKIHKELHEYLKKPDVDIHKFDDMTISIIKTLKESNRIIIGSEIPCRSRVGNFITQADLIVMNDKEEIELIELKTGKLSETASDEKNTKYLKFPLDNEEYNKVSEATLQVVYTALALEETIPELVIDDYLIMNTYVFFDKEDSKDKVETVLHKVTDITWVNKIKNAYKKQKNVFLKYLEN
jgi:hypothetical protein